MWRAEYWDRSGGADSEGRNGLLRCAPSTNNQHHDRPRQRGLTVARSIWVLLLNLPRVLCYDTQRTSSASQMKPFCRGVDSISNDDLINCS